MTARADFRAAVIAALNAMRGLVDAATDVLFDELGEKECWDDHPADQAREIGLKFEQELMEALPDMEIPAEFDRADGTWKVKAGRGA